MVRVLAEREGATVSEVTAAPSGVRSLEEIAIENAVEGCVRETFGAAVAMMQGERAGDTRVRRAMKRIAPDETRHAELAWVARWVDTRLDAAGRRRVRSAREEAVQALTREAEGEPDATVSRRLGMPGARQVHRVLAELRASLWSSDSAA